MVGPAEALSLPGRAGGCSDAGAGDKWGMPVLLVLTKSFRPGEVWGELWVNRAHVSEIMLELGLRRNFPLGEDWQGLEVSFSSFLLMHRAWSQPWLPANVLNKCLPSIAGTCKIVGLWFLQYLGSPGFADGHHSSMQKGA